MSAFGPSAQATANVRSYKEAEAFLAAKGVDSRKICGNNTYVERRNSANIAIRLHQTDIIAFSASGLITLSTGGWYSQITKQRLEQFLPAPLTVFSFKGQWRIGLGDGQRWAMTKAECANSVVFTDGLTLRRHDDVTWEPLNALSLEDEQQLDAAKKSLDKAIKGYLKHVDTKVAEWKVELTEKGSLSPGGDPWCCSMGIGGGDNGHLWQHLREGYVFLTILRKAFEDSGRYRDPVQRLLMDIQFGWADNVKRELRKYLLKHLDPALSVRAEQEKAAKCVEYAEQALTRPDDFGYYGDDESLWVTSAPTFGRNRDSENVEIANYEIVWENLVEKFPDLVKTDQDRKDENPGGIYVFGAGHWACGWVEQIVVPVLKRPGAITADNIHPAFIEVCEAVEATRLYPALPGAEERAAEMDADQIVKDIKGWQEYIFTRNHDPYIVEFTAEHLAQFAEDDYDWSSEGVIELHKRACWQESLAQIDGQGVLL